MDLRQLKYFEMVAELCHFGQAAERLHLAQPALSQSIRRLEQEVGVSLFERTTRQVKLTPAGAYLRTEVRRILADLDGCLDVARALGEGTQGVLRLGFTGTGAFSLLPRVARLLQAAMPQVQLDIHADLLTPTQVTGLLEGSLDMAFLRGRIHEPDIITRPLGDEGLLLALPVEHRLTDEPQITMGDLAAERFLSYSSQLSSLNEALVTSCREAGFSPRIVQRAAGTTSLLALVAAGQGIALVPESARVMQLSGVVLLPIEGTGRIEICLALRADNASTVVARALAVLEAAGVGTEHEHNPWLEVAS